MDKISFCITTFNRVAFTLKCFQQILHDPRIGEILISDDCSEMNDYLNLAAAVAEMGKVKLVRNANNQGCYLNKYMAISLAKYEYCVIADSDNVFDVDYIDAIYRYPWFPRTALLPDWAMPTFSYVHFGGEVI